MKKIEDILGKEEAKCLRDDFNEILMGDCNYGEVEELLLGYGLEMDYLEQLLF